MKRVRTNRRTVVRREPIDGLDFGGIKLPVVTGIPVVHTQQQTMLKRPAGQLALQLVVDAEHTNMVTVVPRPTIHRAMIVQERDIKHRQAEFLRSAGVAVTQVLRYRPKIVEAMVEHVAEGVLLTIKTVEARLTEEHVRVQLVIWVGEDRALRRQRHRAQSIGVLLALTEQHERESSVSARFRSTGILKFHNQLLYPRALGKTYT